MRESFMKKSIYPFALAGAVVAISAGCDGGVPSQSAAPALSPDRAKTDHSPSWMAPDAQRTALLYISDQASNDVFVYSYPGGKLKGTLTGFDQPYGMCTNKAGNVFITNTQKNDILEYRHGGKTPIATLSDTGFYPVGCSVDPTTGNLAVTNFQALGSQPGNVAIYAGAKGTPTTYSDTNIPLYEFCGYDDKGNLFLDGYNATGGFAFAELPTGASSFTDITINTMIYQPGGVQWDGRYVAVGDQYYGNAPASAIHRVRVSGSSGTVVATTLLTQGSDNVQVVQFWKQGTKVVGGNVLAQTGNVWDYPAGGNAVKAISGLKIPYGATISLR
jgi:hypothetical protein